jgi:formylglycine-generating enzyme required for sulfatase activity
MPTKSRAPRVVCPSSAPPARPAPLLGSGWLAILLFACSGEAFHLAGADFIGSGGTAPDAAEQAASAFPPFVPDTSLELPAATLRDAGAVSALSPELPAPELSACGEPRVPDAALANAEVCVPAGTFTMGSTAGVPAGYVAHGPEHQVSLSAYFLDAYEVSVARYRTCVSAGVCTAPAENSAQGCTYSVLPGAHERHPITCVPWQAGLDFCAWDGGRRLPSEAEWERAARGAQSWLYAWGNDFSCGRAVLAGASECSQYSGTLPWPVGSTALGQSAEHAFDLIGNAWEWVADRSGGYGSGSVVDPTGPLTGSTRIQRGGGWQTPPAAAFAYLRRAEAPGAIAPSSFRCARDGVE